jgi:hypothetical protein
MNVQWSPARAEGVALGTIGLGLLAGLVAVDAAGRLLLGAAAVLLLGMALRNLLLRPRLSAGPAGVRVRELGGSRQLAWPGLQVRVRATRRFGVRAQVLELDTAGGIDDDEGVLVVLGRRDLGAEPEEVARALRGLHPPNG